MSSSFDCWRWLCNIDVVDDYVGLRLDGWESLILTHLVRIVVDVEINMVTRLLVIRVQNEVLTGSMIVVGRGAIISLGRLVDMGEVALGLSHNVTEVCLTLWKNPHLAALRNSSSLIESSVSADTSSGPQTILAHFLACVQFGLSVHKLLRAT